MYLQYFNLGIQTVVSLSSRTEHWRPASSILCGFQATELALNMNNNYLSDTDSYTGSMLLS